MNVHQYDAPTPLEQPRISFALNNIAFVISETSVDSPYENLISCDYNQLVEKVLDYLYKPVKRTTMKNLCFETFKEMTIVDMVATQLEIFDENVKNELFPENK